MPHTAAGPLLVTFRKDKPFLCFAWFSHGGLAISFLSLGYDFCFGLYLEDIDGVSAVKRVSIKVGSFVDVDPDADAADGVAESAADRLSVDNTEVHSSLQPSTTEQPHEQSRTRRKFWRVVLQLRPVRDTAALRSSTSVHGDTPGRAQSNAPQSLNVSCLTEWSARQLHLQLIHAREAVYPTNPMQNIFGASSRERGSSRTKHSSRKGSSKVSAVQAPDSEDLGPENLYGRDSSDLRAKGRVAFDEETIEIDSTAAPDPALKFSPLKSLWSISAVSRPTSAGLPASVFFHGQSSSGKASIESLRSTWHDEDMRGLAGAGRLTTSKKSLEAAGDALRNGMAESALAGAVSVRDPSLQSLKEGADSAHAPAQDAGDKLRREVTISTADEKAVTPNHHHEDLEQVPSDVILVMEDEVVEPIRPSLLKAGMPSSYKTGPSRKGGATRRAQISEIHSSFVGTAGTVFGEDDQALWPVFQQSSRAAAPPVDADSLGCVTSWMTCNPQMFCCTPGADTRVTQIEVESISQEEPHSHVSRDSAASSSSTESEDDCSDEAPVIIELPDAPPEDDPMIQTIKASVAKVAVVPCAPEKPRGSLKNGSSRTLDALLDFRFGKSDDGEPVSSGRTLNALLDFNLPEATKSFFGEQKAGSASGLEEQEGSRCGRLEVDVWCACGLRDLGRAATSSTHVRVLLRGLPLGASVKPKLAKTRAVRGSLHSPVWKHRHAFVRKGLGLPGETEEVALEIWSWDPSAGYDFVGYAVVAFPEVPGFHRFQVPLSEHPDRPPPRCRATGVLTGALHWWPDGRQMEDCMEVVQDFPRPLLAWVGDLGVLVRQARGPAKLMASASSKGSGLRVLVEAPVAAADGKASGAAKKVWKTRTQMATTSHDGVEIDWQERCTFTVCFLGPRPPPGEIVLLKLIEGEKENAGVEIYEASSPLPLAPGEELFSLPLDAVAVTPPPQKTAKRQSLLGRVSFSAASRFSRPASVASNVSNLPRLSMSSRPRLSLFSAIGGAAAPKMSLEHLDVRIEWKEPFEGRHASTPEEKSLKAYSRAHDAWRRAAAEHQHAELQTEGEAYADRLTYQFQPWSQIVMFVVKREHILPKLFPRVTPMQRNERFAVLATAIQVAFFVQTFFFRADCLMAPQPAICVKPSHAWYARFVPSLDVFFSTLFGLCCSVPVPLLLTIVFRKVPVEEVLTAAEKRFHLSCWRLTNFIGWSLVVSMNAFIAYYLVLFSQFFDPALFEAWLNSAWLAIFHRLVTAPVSRGLLFAVIIVVSKFTPLCDLCIVLWPHVLPTQSVNRPNDQQEDDGSGGGIDFDF